MAFDGIVLSALTEQLKSLEGMRVEKIYQPYSDEVYLQFRGPGKKEGLYINVRGSSPKLYITDDKPENPSTPPTFCMVLRKHLEGGRVICVSQYKLDRILRIDIESRNELRDDVLKSLYVEIMGKYSNIILVEQPEMRIIDSIKRVNSSMSSKRVVLPGEKYILDVISTGSDPRNIDRDELMYLIENSPGNTSVKNFLTRNFTGISPLIAREICFGIDLDETRPLNSLDDEKREELFQKFSNFFKAVKEKSFRPLIILEGEKYLDFSAVDLSMYPEAEKYYFDDISALLEEYYSKRDNYNALFSKRNELKKTLNSKLSKLLDKRKKQYSELNEALDREKYRIYADILSANLYRIDENVRSVTLENFYSPNQEKIEIPMDIRYSPQQNAQRYYKKYSKLKHAATVLDEQIKENDYLVDYLNSVLFDVENASSPDEIDEIKDELRKENILSSGKASKKKKRDESAYLTFTSSDSYRFIVGKNNRQNEKLSLKDANKKDLWFHVKEAPGSHVILKNDGRDFTDISLRQAAALAAKYSSLKNSNNIEVDYTWIRNVKRHPSNLPGLVSYTNYKTIVVKKEDLKIIEDLSS